jgi:hypothetical protein
VDPKNLDAVRLEADASGPKAAARLAPLAARERPIPQRGCAKRSFDPEIDSLHKAYESPVSSISDSRPCLHQPAA